MIRFLAFLYSLIFGSATAGLMYLAWTVNLSPGDFRGLLLIVSLVACLVATFASAGEALTERKKG